MSESEYDAEIAPLLMVAAKRCEELGYPMVAVVEYGSDQRAETRVLSADAGLPMIMLAMVSKHGRNVDGLLINLIKHCNQHNIDLSQSMFLNKYAKLPAPHTKETSP